MASVHRPQIELSVRPSHNKEMHLFEPYDDLFDQYVEPDLIQLSDNILEQHSSDHLAALFEDTPTNGTDPNTASPTLKREARTDEAWHQALRQLEQNPASPTLQALQSSIYPESRGRASASDPEIFSVDEFLGLRPQPSLRVSSSTPGTPTPPTHKGKSKALIAIAQPIARSFRNGIRKATRRLSVSPPKMMRPSQYRTGSYHDHWTKRIDASADAYNHHLHLNSLTSSPPRTEKLSQDQSSNSFLSGDFSLTSGVTNRYDDAKHNMNEQSHYQLTPLSSPTIDHNSTNRQSSFRSSNDHANYFSHHQLSNEALSALQTPPLSHRLPISTWGIDTTDSFDFNIPASPDFNDSAKAAAFWGSGSAPQPCAPAYHHPHPESSDMSFGSVPANGLGISIDLGFGDQAPAYPASASQQLSGVYPNAMPPAHGFAADTPPSRSPSSSPPPHRISGRRASSRPCQHSGQSHRRKLSNSSAGGPRPAGVGFVNFTPDDSRKILTGVAPSGSSKTKARREKEAADKRRKLSQAATQAIIEAGGDLTKLRNEGLLCFGAEE